jgi:HNH endonuclease
MKHRYLEMEFFETYYFANVLHNLLTDSFPFLRTLDSFFGDLGYKRFLHAYPKYSALHQFVEFIIETEMYEEIDDVTEDALVHDKGFRLWAETALSSHAIDHIPFRAWLDSEGISLDDISEDVIVDYHRFLRDDGPLDVLFERMTEEVFFLMFMNREFLHKFNEMIAYQISNLVIDGLASDEKQLFRKDGVLKRVGIPTWARRAVFYRDRGQCSSCHRDISGLVSIHSDKHYDHIVPLAAGGVNDVSNLQLLCERCNLGKQDKNIPASKYYERWYV